MSDDVGTEIATIQQTMRTDMGAYRGNPGMQARYRDLLRARDSGGKAPAPAAGDAKELEAIKKRMRGDRQGYNKDAAMQARFREIVGGGSPPQASTESKAVLPIPRGATQMQVAAAHVASDVLLALPADDQKSLEDSFNALPQAVIFACAQELAAGRLPAKGITPESLAEFAGTARGRVLVPEWGVNAKLKFGRLHARLDRLLDRMPDQAARAAFEKWLKGLPMTQARTLFEVITK